MIYKASEEKENRSKDYDVDAIMAISAKIKIEISSIEEKHNKQLKPLTTKLEQSSQKLKDLNFDFDERVTKLEDLAKNLEDIQSNKIKPKGDYDSIVIDIKEKQKKLREEVEIIKKEMQKIGGEIEPLKKEIAELKKKQSEELIPYENKYGLQWRSLLGITNIQQFKGKDIEAIIDRSPNIIEKIRVSNKTPQEYMQQLKSEYNSSLSLLDGKAKKFEDKVNEKKLPYRLELLRINLAKQQQLMTKEKEFINKLTSVVNNTEMITLSQTDVQKLFYMSEKLAINNATQIINEIKNDDNKGKFVQLEIRLQQLNSLQQTILNPAINNAVPNLNAEQQFNVLCYLSANKFSDLNGKASLMTKWTSDLSASHDRFPDYVTPQKLNNLFSSSDMDDKFIAHIKDGENYKSYLNILENSKGIKVDNIQRVLFKTLISMETPDKKEEFYNRFQNYLTPDALAQYQVKFEERSAQLETNKNRLPKQIYDKEKQALINEKQQFYELNKYMIDKQLNTLKSEFAAMNSHTNDLPREKIKDLSIRVNSLRTIIQKADSTLNALGAEQTLLKEQKKELAQLISTLAKKDLEIMNKNKGNDLNSSTSNLTETMRKSSNASTNTTDLSDSMSRTSTPLRKSTWISPLKPPGTPPVDSTPIRKDSDTGLLAAWNKSTRPSYESRHSGSSNDISPNEMTPINDIYESYKRPLPPTPLDAFANTQSSDNLRSSGSQKLRSSQNSTGSSGSLHNSTAELQTSPELPTLPSPTRRSP